MTIDEVRRLLGEARTRSRKDLGQHFLIDEAVLAQIVESANIQPDEAVVEIGPGLGVLTEQLVTKSKQVIAFELDDVLASLIVTKFPEVEIVRGDVLKTASTRLGDMSSFKVVANIPYQITTPLLRLLLETELADKVTTLTLLIQKEVAERLCAAPAGSGRGYLSVVTQCYADVSYVCTVKPESFWPSPKVDSAVIHIAPRPLPSFLQDSTQRKAFFKFLHALFRQPRKQLKNVYGSTYHVSPERVREIFEEIGLSSNARAQELHLEQWYSLFKNRS